jgi:hypothetical protein
LEEHSQLSLLSFGVSGALLRQQQANSASRTASPDGPIARLSVAIHGERFWRVQLADVTRQRQRAENWNAERADIRAKTDDILRKSEELINGIYKAHPGLTSTDAQLAAQHHRALADKIEEQENERIVSEYMRARVPVLKQCEDIITAQL